MSELLPVLSLLEDRPALSRTAKLLLYLIASWLVLMVAGAAALSMPDALGAAHPVSFTRAVFTSVNAATASGFSQQFARTEDFSPFVQWVLSFENMGGILLSLIAGGIVLSAVLRLDIRAGKIASASALMIGIAAGVGVLTRTGDSLSQSMDRGIRALGGAGPAHQLSGWSDLYLNAALTPLALLGSLGALTILMLPRMRSWPAEYRRHLSNVFVVAAGAYLIGFGLIFAQFLIVEQPVKPAIASANAIALATRGWGTSADFASAWPRGVAWTAMALSLLGVGTLGAMPGLGVACLVTFARQLWPTILALLAIEAAVALVALLALLHTEPQLPAERILMLVVSSIAKTGLSHEGVSITGTGLLTLSGVMVISKLLPIGLIVCTTRPDSNPMDLIHNR